MSAQRVRRCGAGATTAGAGGASHWSACWSPSVCPACSLSSPSTSSGVRIDNRRSSRHALPPATPWALEAMGGGSCNTAWGACRARLWWQQGDQRRGFGGGGGGGDGHVVNQEGARQSTGGKVGKNAWNGGAGRAGARRAAAQRQGVELSGFSGAAAPFYSICWVCFVISMPWLDRRHHELSDIRSTSVSSRHREMDGWRNFWGQEVPKNGRPGLCVGGVPRWLT